MLAMIIRTTTTSIKTIQATIIRIMIMATTIIHRMAKRWSSGQMRPT